MEYVVVSRDLKWEGKRLERGETFHALTDRQKHLASVLVKVNRVELAPKRPSAPVRQAAMAAPVRAPAPRVQPPVPASAPTTPATTAAAPAQPAKAEVDSQAPAAAPAADKAAD